MPASRGFAAALVLLAVTACSSDGDLDDASGSTAPTTQATVTSAPATTPPPTTAAPTTKPPASKIGGVTVGKYAEDPAVTGFARFVQARVAALRQRNARYAPMLALSTRNRQPVDRTLIDQMVKDDLVFQGNVRYVIIGAATTGQRSRIKACQRDDASWFLNRRTGEKSDTKPIWTSHDVRMVLQSGTWKVDAVTAAKFSCSEAR